MDRLLSASRTIERLLHAIAMAAGWLFIVCTVVIVFDVLTRKFGFQIAPLVAGVVILVAGFLILTR